MAKRKSTVKLMAGSSIGELTAEDDHTFLNECFVNLPLIDALKEVSSHQSIVLGRTGSGKSAILWHLENTLENVSRIDPKEVAFEYMGNSPVIRQITDVGVDLQTLYQYLWTHVLALHITKECLGTKGQDGLPRIMDMISNMVWKDQKKQVALNYLEKHGDRFWLNVEQISSEITDQISERLASGVNLSAAAFKSKLEVGTEWQDAEKRLFKHRAQEVVSALQMRDLKETINALAECANTAKNYYILIDDLDLDWAGDDKAQYSLIKALIDCLKTFRRIPNLKIIIAMREDLFEATLRSNKDKHFQAEKYEGVTRRLRWDDAQLNRLMDLRIQKLSHYQYMKKSVKLEDVLPTLVGGVSVRSFIIDRTLRRPRDIIAFVNKILVENEGRNLPLLARAVNKAEPGYSRDRLRALEDEWRSCHPLVTDYLKSLDGFSGPITIGDLNEDKLFGLLYGTSDLKRKAVDDVERLAISVYDRDKELRIKKLARAVVVSLYKMGAIGVKLYADEGYTYSYQKQATLEDSEIGEDTKIIVHEMLASSLGCRRSLNEAA
jgi:hypothetical protein